MRRFFAGILVLALVLWETGCGHNPEFKPEPTAYSFSDEEKLSFVWGEDASYYLSAEGLCRYDYDAKNGTASVTLLVKEAKLSQLQAMDGMLYYVQTGDTEEDFSLCRVAEDGGTPETVFTRQTICGAQGIQLQEWQLHNGLFYVQVDTALYVYDPAVGQGKLLKDDVATFALEGNTLYHIDHGSRTFTIYRTDLTAGQQEILLGDGTYEGKGSDETVYKQFCLLNGVLYYTTKSPSGLYRYENGQSTLISDNDAIDEFSLCTDNGSIYYVERDDTQATLMEYCPATGSVETVTTVSDYHRTETVKDACFYYSSYDADTGKQTLHKQVLATIVTEE